MALRFNQRDFLGLREEMIRFMSEKLGEKWNDYSESDETITLIELLAHCVSNLHFAFDNQKRETDIITASFPRNIYAHAIRNGYKPSLFKAGSTWLNIDLRKKTTNGVVNEFTTIPVSITIPRYTQIKNSNGDICITNREFIIPAGTSHYSIEVFAGEYAFEQFTRNDINDFNYIVLNRLNVAHDTWRLFYQKEEWTPVIDVYTDPRSSKIYSIEPNFVQNGVRIVLKFFSNWPNEITDNSTIILEYIQTFGANSNYDKDTFSSYKDLNDLTNNEVSFDDDIFDSSGNNITSWTDVDFSFSQPKAFVGGQNFESIDVIRKSYLQSIRETTSLVVLNDYYAFITLKGINEFYVTDWNKNNNEFITIEYPRDIKALKAEPDINGHSIYSKENKTKDPYWSSDVSYINEIDNITETRKIKGREIIIYKSFDVNINNFSQYQDEHWYKEWIRASKLKTSSNSNTNLLSTIYVKSPDAISNISESIGNYDNELAFIGSESRCINVVKNLISDLEHEDKLRVFVYNILTKKLLCANFNDLNKLSQIRFNCSEQFCTNLFNSYNKKNEITTIILDNTPVYFEESEFYSSNIADVMFSSKNNIYTDEFVDKLKELYTEKYYNDLQTNEQITKKSLEEKISSITIKIEGIEQSFNVPKELWFDTFLLIDGSSKTNYIGENSDYTHSLNKELNTVYSTIGVYNNYYVNDFLVDIHQRDSNNLSILNLYSSKDNKNTAVDSGDLDYSNPVKLYSNIGLCFRKKNIDLLNNLNFSDPLQDNVITYSNDDVYFSDGEKTSYIQTSECIYIPILNDLTNVDQTTAYKLKNIRPSFYVKKDESIECFDNDYNAYKAIVFNQDDYPIVIASDELYHDDFIFDDSQLTVKPLNINYYKELLSQNSLSNIANDTSDILYVEEHLVNNCNDYVLTEPVDYQELIDSIDLVYGYEAKFGFLRTSLSIVGNHCFDYKSKQNDAINLIEPINDINKRIEYIKRSFLIEVQTTYPKYLKYLILKICFINTASYLMSHEQLNKLLVEIGVDNIIYALNKISEAEFSVNYWYSDSNSTIGKQYTYSPNENKRFLCCGGTTSWNEELSPAKNYFRWNVVYPEIVDLYQSIQQKQGRGDNVFILPYQKEGIDIHAHIFINESTANIASVFENIWNALINMFGLLKNIEEIKYLSEIISVIQSSDVNIMKICTLNEVSYNGYYTLDTLSSEDIIYRTDVSESSVKDFFRFLKFAPVKDIQPKTNLGQSLVLGNVCIRLQKSSSLDKTVYHFERSCFKIETTLAYKLRQQN